MTTKATQHRSKSDDFLSRFGLRTTPFTREIQVEEQFPIDAHEKVVDALEGVIHQRGSGALIAPSGTGKTQDVRRLRSRLPEARYRITYVKVTGVSKRDLCRHISMAIGAEPAGSYPTLVERLQERWQHLTRVDSLHPIIILDDAHEMRVDVLGMLKVLTNFDFDSRLGVSILLVGQTGLSRLLCRDELEDVTRRLSHVATLEPLSREQAHRYLEHRVTIAGARRFPFNDRAVEMIYDAARGNLRATDQLGLKCLETAHLHDSDLVDVSHVMEARKLVCP